MWQYMEKWLQKCVMINQYSALCLNNLPLSKSHRQGGSSGSHVEVQSKSFPEASGPSSALSTRLDLRKRKARSKVSNTQM